MFLALRPLFEHFAAEGYRFSLKESGPKRLTLLIDRSGEAHDENVLPSDSFEAFFTEYLRNSGHPHALVHIYERRS